MAVKAALEEAGVETKGAELTMDALHPDPDFSCRCQEGHAPDRQAGRARRPPERLSQHGHDRRGHRRPRRGLSSFFVLRMLNENGTRPGAVLLCREGAARCLICIVFRAIPPRNRAGRVLSVHTSVATIAPSMRFCLRIRRESTGRIRRRELLPRYVPSRLCRWLLAHSIESRNCPCCPPCAFGSSSIATSTKTHHCAPSVRGTHHAPLVERHGTGCSADSYSLGGQEQVVLRVEALGLPRRVDDRSRNRCVCTEDSSSFMRFARALLRGSCRSAQAIAALDECFQAPSCGLSRSEAISSDPSGSR